MKKILKRILPSYFFISIQKIFISIKSKLKSHDLNYLALINNTDKFGKHFYTPHYKFHFKSFRKKKIKLLEIGVGGYDNPKIGGGSLKMWKSYFSKGMIFGVDIFDKSDLEESRIKIFQGSQVDFQFLEKVILETERLDIIIDDGSHINSHVIDTFKFLFPKLEDGGIYVVEDTQTSYWQEFGGNKDNFNSLTTTMSFFKELSDKINFREIPGFVKDEEDFCDILLSIHFYHNIIFLYKGKNTEPSNLRG